MKKLLCLALATVILMLTLSSCFGDLFHRHEYGEWVVTKEVGCTTDGSRERYCDCGDVVYETIYHSGHAEENGVCSRCKEILDPYKALVDYVKKNGKRSSNSYAIGREVTSSDLDRIVLINYNIDTEELSFAEQIYDGSSTVLTAISYEPSATMQEARISYELGTEYLATGEISPESFHDEKYIYSYATNAPSSISANLKSLFAASIAQLLTDMPPVLEDTGITMEMLGFKGY